MRKMSATTQAAWHRLVRANSRKTKARLGEDFLVECDGSGSILIPSNTEVSFFCNMGPKSRPSPGSPQSRWTRTMAGVFFLPERQVKIYSDASVVIESVMAVGTRTRTVRIDTLGAGVNF